MYVGGKLPVVGGVVVCVVWVFLGWAVLIVHGRCVLVRGWGQWWWGRRIWTPFVGDICRVFTLMGGGVVVRQGAAAGPGWSSSFICGGLPFVTCEGCGGLVGGRCVLPMGSGEWGVVVRQQVAARPGRWSSFIRGGSLSVNSEGCGGLDGGRCVSPMGSGEWGVVVRS